MQDEGWDLNGSNWTHRFNSTYRRILPSPIRVRLSNELRDCRTILDLGCGPQSRLGIPGIQYSVGVEQFEPYIRSSKSKAIHDDYILADVRSLAFKPRSFDAVVAFEVIEHLPKEDAVRLLGDMENWASRVVIVTTPNGFVHQDAYDGNPSQVHRSSWSAEDFVPLGYLVVGIGGPRALRDAEGKIKYRPSLLWAVVSDLCEWPLSESPERSFQLWCVKRLDDSRKAEDH